MIDLHNDLITAENVSAEDKLRLIEKDLKDGANVYYAIFLGGKNEEYLNGFSWAKQLQNLSMEDIGGIEDINEILPFNPKPHLRASSLEILR